MHRCTKTAYIDNNHLLSVDAYIFTISPWQIRIYRIDISHTTVKLAFKCMAVRKAYRLRIQIQTVNFPFLRFFAKERKEKSLQLRYLFRTKSLISCYNRHSQRCVWDFGLHVCQAVMHHKLFLLCVFTLCMTKCMCMAVA